MGKIRNYKSKETFDDAMKYIHTKHIEHGHEKFVNIAGKRYKPSHKKESF